MKFSAGFAIALGLSLVSLSACEDAGLMMQYYLTPAGWQAQGVVNRLNEIGGHDGDSDKKSDNNSKANKAPANKAGEEVGYLDDANLKQSLNAASNDISAADKTASIGNQQLLELLMRSAVAANDNSSPVIWNTQKLQKFFGKIPGLEQAWGQNPTLNIQKNGPLHYSLITLQKNGAPAAAPHVALQYTTQSDDICRTADAVLRTSDKLAMEMVNKNGEKKNIPHPFGGKPCSKTELQKGFRGFAVNLDNGSVRGSATPELAVIWKTDPKDNSVWLIHYRAPGVSPQADLVHTLQKFL